MNPAYPVSVFGLFHKGVPLHQLPTDAWPRRKKHPLTWHIIVNLGTIGKRQSEHGLVAVIVPDVNDRPRIRPREHNPPAFESPVYCWSSIDWGRAQTNTSRRIHHLLQSSVILYVVKDKHPLIFRRPQLRLDLVYQV